MEGSRVGRSWEARAFTYRSVFILQAGAGDGAAIQKDLTLGRGHLPTPLELVVQQRILLKDEPSHLPVVDNVTLRTDRRACQVRCVQAEVSHDTGRQSVPRNQLSNKGDGILFFFLSLILFFNFEIISIQRKVEE